MNKRYGRFRFLDYWSLWILIIVSLVCSIYVVFFSQFRVLGFLPMFISTVYVIAEILPYREEFCISDNTIIIKKGNSTQKIAIPRRITLILSQTAIRDTFGIQSYILHNKISISIVNGNDLDSTLELLHSGYVKKYMSDTIVNSFNDKFVFDFVCGIPQLEQLLNYSECVIILPESLWTSIPEDVKSILNSRNLYIDKRY